MTTPRDPHSPVHDPVGSGAKKPGRHGWMMMACCVPMLAIAVGLVLAGVVSPGFLLVAVACTAMMAMMMRGMGHSGDGHS